MYTSLALWVHNREAEYFTTLRKVLELRRWWKVHARAQGGAQSHKHVNQWCVERSIRLPEPGKDVLYKDSNFEIDRADLEQSELPYLTKWNPTIPWDHQIPRNILERGHKARSLKNLWQWKITFPNCRVLRTSNMSW